MGRKPRTFSNIGISTSYAVGFPIGTGVIILTLFAPSLLSGEGLPTMVMMAVYGKAIVGFVIAFLFSLWFAGKRIADNLAGGKTVLAASFKYSLTVNSIIWPVFIVLTIIENFETFSLLFLIPPVIAFLLCIGLTVVSVGLLVCKIVRIKINKLTRQRS